MKNNKIDFEDLACMIPGQLSPIFEGIEIKTIYMAMLKTMTALAFSLNISEEDQLDLYKMLIQSFKETHEK
jgi:hypothetical protein